MVSESDALFGRFAPKVASQECDEVTLLRRNIVSGVYPIVLLFRAVAEKLIIPSRVWAMHVGSNLQTSLDINIPNLPSWLSDMVQR